MNRVMTQDYGKEKLKSRLVLQVHDELLIETAKEEVEQVSAISGGGDEQGAAQSVPWKLEIDMHTGMKRNNS